MPPVIPNYDLGLLITLDIELAILGLLITFAGMWTILWQTGRNTTYLAEIAERTTRSTERVAETAECIDARLRRQFPDIGEDLR